MNQLEQIKYYFNNIKITKNKIQKLLQITQLKQYLNNQLSNNPNWNIIDILKFIKYDITPAKCHHCGKKLTYKKTITNQKYCNRECSKNSKEQHQLISQNIRKVYKEKGNLIKEKIKQTCLKRYGVTTNLAFANCHGKEKIEKTKQNNLKKYGVTSTFCIDQIIEKTNQGKYRKKWKNILLLKEYVTPEFTENDFVYNHDNTKLKWKCTKCGNIFLQKQTIRIKWINNQLKYIPRCMKCYPYTSLGISRKELELVKFCKEYYPNLIHSDKKLIHPKEIDIIIPELKLCIEFNGIWYHSLENEYILNYHLNKTQQCQKLGYRLIHIWQDEWDNNKEIIKNKLINIFTNNESINYNQILCRDWYQVKQINGYNLQIIPPKIINRKDYHCENTGYLKYTKIINI